MTLNLLVVPVGAVLWYLGGCGDECTHRGGLLPLNKKWRRLVWPGVVGLLLAGNGLPLIIAGGVATTMAMSLSMGYGEKKRWPERAMVGIFLGLPFVLINQSWVWPIVVAGTFMSLYWLSLRYNWMVWHVVEASMGATQGACILAALLLR